MDGLKKNGKKLAGAGSKAASLGSKAAMVVIALFIVPAALATLSV